MKCEKCQKELPTLGGKWTSRCTVFFSYLGCEIDLCSDCYEHYKKSRKVFEHEFLTGSPRECMTMQLNFNKENMKELCDRIVEQIRNGELQLVEGPKGDWNSLSDGRPACTGLYLVSIDDLVTTMSFDGTGFRNHGGESVEVDAWMPLPEPYKSEVQDEDS